MNLITYKEISTYRNGKLEVNKVAIPVQEKSIIQQAVNINDDNFINDETGLSVGSINSYQLSKQ